MMVLITIDDNDHDWWSNYYDFDHDGWLIDDHNWWLWGSIDHCYSSIMVIIMSDDWLMRINDDRSWMIDNGDHKCWFIMTDDDGSWMIDAGNVCHDSNA